MTATSLGTLKRVEVRKAWSHEANDFTPWIADNLDSLSAELGIELELEGREVVVGSYRADVVARVPQSDARVLIENQLEWADLQHLGQILTYLAGLEAKIIVWIAKGFRDEHLSAIRWLNEHTVDPFAFFAVQVGVVQIGDSLLAPTFDILERPNQWNRQVQVVSRSGELSGKGEFQREFWSHCLSSWNDRPKLRQNYALPHVWHRLVKGSDLRVVQYVSSKSVGNYIRGKSDKEDITSLAARIEPYRRSLKEALRGPNFAEKYNPDCRTVLEINTQDRKNWDKMSSWLEKQRIIYEAILSSNPETSEQN